MASVSAERLESRRTRRTSSWQMSLHCCKVNTAAAEVFSLRPSCFDTCWVLGTADIKPETRAVSVVGMQSSQLGFCMSTSLRLRASSACECSTRALAESRILYVGLQADPHMYSERGRPASLFVPAVHLDAWLLKLGRRLSHVLLVIADGLCQYEDPSVCYSTMILL